jgi:hypothetical protein
MHALVARFQNFLPSQQPIYSVSQCSLSPAPSMSSTTASKSSASTGASLVDVLPPRTATLSGSSSGHGAALHPLRRLSLGYVTWSRQYTLAHRNQCTTAKRVMADPKAVALLRSAGWWEDGLFVLLQSATEHENRTWPGEALCHSWEIFWQNTTLELIPITVGCRWGSAINPQGANLVSIGR